MEYARSQGRNGRWYQWVDRKAYLCIDQVTGAHSIRLDVRRKSLEINGFRFFACKKAGKLTSALKYWRPFTWRARPRASMTSL